MKKMMLMAIAIVFTVLSVSAANVKPALTDTAKTKKVKPAKVQYTCLMHPDVLSGKPGRCPKPKCGMILVKKQPGSKPGKMKM